MPEPRDTRGDLPGEPLTKLYQDSNIAEPLLVNLKIAMDGVTTHLDGLWHEIKVGTILVHRLPMQPQEPT
jgi:hypothetical protein